MLLLAELCGGSPVLLHILGGSQLLARASHWHGLPGRPGNPLRFSGTAITWTIILASAGYVLYLRFQLS